MPVYQYKGQYYELSETDPAAAKAKILSHLGEQAPAAPVSPPQTLAAQAGLDQRPSTPAGFMLRPEFVEQVRSEYGNFPPEQRRAALQEASMGRGVRADAAKRILADLAVEDQRRREVTQGREGLMGILAAAQQQPAPRQPAAPAGPAPRVQFPDVSPTIGDIMDMVPEQERIQRRLAQDEAARTLEAAESSIEATRAREQERMGGLEQIGKSFTEVGIPTAEAGALGLTAVAQQAQMAKIGDQLKELEAQGQGNTPQADRLRKVLEHYSSRQQVYLGDLAQTQAKLSTAPVYRGVRELTEAETFTDAAKAFARNPVSIVANLTAQSLPSMLPALVLGVINPALGVAAMGGSSYGVEFGNELLGFAREKGFDTTDPKQMAQFMQNSELLREGVNRAGTKAGIVAAGDMLLTGLAAKTLVPKRITGPVAKNVTNVGVQMGVQGVGGAGTEALAQYVTTGEIKPGEVVAEAVGELGGAPAEVFTQTAQARREARAAQAAQAAQPPAPAAPVPPAPVPPAPAAPAERIEPTFDERAVPPAPAERVEPTLEGAPVPSPAAQTMREQQDAIEKMEREALKLEPGEPVQEAAKDALQIEPEPPQTELPRQAVVEVPVGQLKLSEDVPQFKMGADKAGIVEPLGGKFERTGVAPIQVWRRNDGRMEIISGRHRFDLAKRSGEKTIPAQIHDESKGFTRDMAAVLDAELNIRDGQGKVKDYVNYFKGTGLDRETANARGLLARAPGKRAFSIANDGSDELITGVRADQIPDEAAYLIAINAPGDARLQSVGIKAIADGKSAATAVNMMQAVRALAGEADTTTDMFGFDDSAIKEAEEMAKIASRKQKEIQTRLSAISGAARNPQLAASEGIDIRDPQAVNNRINELRQMKASWDNWSTNPQLVAEVRAERGVAPPVLTTQTPEELRAKAEREERARKEEQAKPAEVPPAEEFVLTGSERAADEAAARGQMELAPAEEKAEAKPGEAVDENDTGFRGASDEEVSEVAGAFKDAKQSQEDERETRVFDPPAKNEVVRIEDKVRVYTKDRGYMTLDEAKQEIAKWRQHAFEQGDTGVNANKVVLSLFDLTGEWSMPWDAAGYQVFRFDIQTDPEYGDVSKFSGDFFNDIFGAFDGQDIYAILAACPCTDFASSGARHFAAKDEDGRTLESVELVRQTLATIEYFKPSVWAIENPVGRIEKLTGLPPWRSSWNPNHFGDPYTKKTLLWGRFNADMPIAPVEATEGSKMHRMYGGKSKATKNARSVTPEGFAYAFFMANNAVDNPVLAISNKYDLMDRAVFEEAVNAGMTYEEISEVIDDPYYFDKDYKRAEAELREAIKSGGKPKEQTLFSIERNLPPPEYDFSSQQPVAGEQSRSPSLKRKVKTLNRQREDKKITPEKFVEEVDAAVKADEERKYYKATAKRVRGADYIRQRLLEAKRRGELSEEGVNLAEWFILQNENLVGDLGVAIKSPKKGGTAGFYESSRRIMALMKESGNEATIVHEILHHTERMMPVEMQDAIRKEWLRSLVSAQKKAKTPEEKFFFEAVMNHHFGSGTIGDLKDAAAFTLRLSKMGLDTGLYDRSYRIAIEMLRRGMVKMSDYQFVNPSEFWAVNASEIVKGRYEAIQGGLLARMKNWLKELGQKIKGIFGLKSDAPLIKALNSLSEGDGKFVSKDMLSSQEDYLQIGKNIYGRKPLAAWTMPDETKLDADLIYRLQNKQIDLKRAVDAIDEAAGGIEDRWDAYLQEELYHGRTARETANFLREEVRPLLEAMNDEGVSIAEIDDYLHNRFAEERNIQIAKINPAYPNDGTPGSGGSGIDTSDAQAYLNNLTPEQRAKYERIAKMVDNITKGTREYLVDSGLEERSTIDAWEKTYPSYVPLNRGDIEYTTTISTGTGQGYSVRGPSSRRATGSRRTVVDILPNIIMQRERAIVRGEKNRVSVATYGLALQNPNPEVWLAVNPQAKESKKKAINELISMGLTKQDAEGLMEEPTVTVVDPLTGLVTKRVNPALRGADNVLVARVNGQDRYVFFNTQNPRAARMVASLKNLDADQLGTALSLIATGTRWFASVNTQYNPIFGVFNFFRDFQGAAVQLSGTPLANERKKILWPSNIAGAMSGIYSTLRKERAGLQPATKQWADLWQDFQAQGGQTGYRDMFSRSQERATALQREIDRMNQGVVRRGGNAIFGWLADYNETLENAVRLSAYKAGLDAGMSKERAASVAKNLTVNFNRKGQIGVQAGALFAFFNSAVQGTTRLLQTVAKMERPGDIRSLRLTKAGKVVIYGGLLLGTAQAIALAAMGYDENEPPDFVKDRNLIIPLGDGKYLAWPLPLGYHVIPAVARILTEWMIAGGKDPAKRIAHLADVILDAFNPIGNAGWSAQSISPTVFDPLVALFENKDWTGKKIAKEDVSKLDPTPGYTRAKENASWISRQLSYYLNLASGGDKDKPGEFSPTPDQIDYLIGQVTGGLGREILKAAKTTEAMITGEELAPYNIPLAGRFYGDTKAGYAESSRFYKNLEELNILENQLKGRQSRKESVTEFVKENPKLRLVESARETERNIRELRKQRNDLVEKGASREAVKAKENLITNQMKRLNDQVKKLEETPRKPAN
jgi:hypothetical protein